MGCTNSKSAKQLQDKAKGLMDGDKIIKDSYSEDVKNRLQKMIDKIKAEGLEDANKELIKKGHKYLKQNIRYLKKTNKDAGEASQQIDNVKARIKSKIEKRNYKDEMAFLDDELEKTGYVYLVPYRRQFRALKQNQGDKDKALVSIQGEGNDEDSESQSSGEE